MIILIQERYVSFLLKLFLNFFFFFGRICPFTGKKANRANKVSFSNHKTKKLQFVNLQYKKVWWEAGNRFVKLRLSTKAVADAGSNVRGHVPPSNFYFFFNN